MSCGSGAAADGQVGPTGGEVCLPDRKVCISVPPGALETVEVIRINTSSDSPGGALSDTWDISAASGQKLTFVKPAVVTFSLDGVRLEGIENENILRVYSREAGADWQPLDKAFVDRVRNQVQGETSHLSPFVVMRSDRLSDGGLPIELDGGVRDGGGVIIVPPFDAGHDAGTMMPPDSGTPDSGTPDSGVVDSGVPDAGPVDAGQPDAGRPDSGVPDAGVDAGVPDAGVDAGAPDAGVDAGVDAGQPDAGSDAGIDDGGVDAGLDDGGADGGDAG